MKSTAETRKVYSGTHRSLVIALDVGTTFSGVSYAILEPGEVPKIHGVTRFPGQEHVAGNSKIPSVMYYDKQGKMRAAGAEAENASMASQAEDEGWTKAELFKLRLRPKSMKLEMNGMRLSPLPRRKSPTEVFGDFLSYLFLCTRNFILDTHASGHNLWSTVSSPQSNPGGIQFVLSHPNGWEGAQQSRMRRAAIYGGLIPDTNEGKARIRFVTEGESSLHACVLNGLAADVLSNPEKPGFLVADAGGGTLDISSYAIRGTTPLVIEEIAPPDCIFAGSVFVSRRARLFLEEKLRNSKYGTADALDHITKRFDETTKRLFRDAKEAQFVPFGSPLDKDQAVGIRGGQLKLTGDEVAQLFEPSVNAIVQSVKAQIDASAGIVKSVWLVGGFAASPYLFKQMQERLAPLGVTVSRPDSQTSKAVADGAIGFYCDHHVSARMSKFMYGVEYLREFDELDPDHVARRQRLTELPSGPKLLPDAFDCILARSVKVKESTVFSRKYCTELTSLSTLSVFEVEVWCYRGGNSVPKWIMRQADNFSTLCVVRADLSPLAGSASAKQGKNSKTYWTIVFSVEIHFGLTEFKARIKWVDNGKTRYGPASIVYNESGHRAEEEEPEDINTEDDIARPAASDRSQEAIVPPTSIMNTPSYGSAGRKTTFGDLNNGQKSVASSIYGPPLSSKDKGKDKAKGPYVDTASLMMGASNAPSVVTGLNTAGNWDTKTPITPGGNKYSPYTTTAGGKTPMERVPYNPYKMPNSTGPSTKELAKDTNGPYGQSKGHSRGPSTAQTPADNFVTHSDYFGAPPPAPAQHFPQDPNAPYIPPAEEPSADAALEGEHDGGYGTGTYGGIYAPAVPAAPVAPAATTTTKKPKKEKIKEKEKEQIPLWSDPVPPPPVEEHIPPASPLQEPEYIPEPEPEPEPIVEPPKELPNISVKERKRLEKLGKWPPAEAVHTPEVEIPVPVTVPDPVPEPEVVEEKKPAAKLSVKEKKRLEKLEKEKLAKLNTEELADPLDSMTSGGNFVSNNDNASSALFGDHLGVNQETGTAPSPLGGDDYSISNSLSTPKPKSGTDWFSGAGNADQETQEETTGSGWGFGGGKKDTAKAGGFGSTVPAFGATGFGGFGVSKDKPDEKKTGFGGFGASKEEKKSGFGAKDKPEAKKSGFGGFGGFGTQQEENKSSFGLGGFGSFGGSEEPAPTGNQKDPLGFNWNARGTGADAQQDNNTFSWDNPGAGADTGAAEDFYSNVDVDNAGGTQNDNNLSWGENPTEADAPPEEAEAEDDFGWDATAKGEKGEKGKADKNPPAQELLPEHELDPLAQETPAAEADDFDWAGGAAEVKGKKGKKTKAAINSFSWDEQVENPVEPPVQQEEAPPAGWGSVDLGGGGGGGTVGPEAPPDVVEGAEGAEGAEGGEDGAKKKKVVKKVKAPDGDADDAGANKKKKKKK